MLVQSAVWVHDRFEMFEEWGLVCSSGVQFPIDTRFNDVLHYHPHEVICPDDACVHLLGEIAIAVQEVRRDEGPCSVLVHREMEKWCFVRIFMLSNSRSFPSAVLIFATQCLWPRVRRIIAFFADYSGSLRGRSPPCSTSVLAKALRASALRPSTMRSKREFSASSTLGVT